MKKIISIGLTAVLFIGATGCATQQSKSSSGADRQVSAVPEGAMTRFIESLSRESSAGRAEFEAALVEAINRDADRLSISRIRSIEDLKTLSPSKQMQLIKRLAEDSAFKDTLGVSSDAVRAARTEAAAARDIRPAVGNGVPEIGALSAGETMVSKSAKIKQLIGADLLGERCSSLQNQEAIRNLNTIVDGTYSDVVSGSVKNQKELAADVEDKLADTTGTNRRIAHNRRCKLAQPKADKGGCAVFSEAMYAGCLD
jgi:hypothetical protein